MPKPTEANTLLHTRAAEVGALAAKYADDAEADRKLRVEVVEAMTAAGFARHFVPARHGGAEGTVSELVRAMVTVGEHCSSAAWCGLIFATSGRMAAFLPRAGRDELWSAGPDQRIAAALVPSGTSEPEAGGWRLRGEWHLLSGVDFADWALLCTRVRNADDVEERFLLVPRAEFDIRQTWFNLGMRATGSNTVELRDVFVPAHRSFTRAALFRGSHQELASACFNVPLPALAAPLFAAASIGPARGALAAWSSWTATRSAGDGPLRRAEGAQLVLARSSAEIDAAALLVERAAAVADDPSAAARLAGRNARDASQAADLVKAAVDRLFAAGGSQAQQDGNPLQRAWRDVHVATSHAVLRFETNARAFAGAEWPDNGGKR
jgi:two-component flavin-dependent monooxygenase